MARQLKQHSDVKASLKAVTSSRPAVDQDGLAGPTESVMLASFVQRTMGPLPHPEILAKYGKIAPDLVDRIVTMAEKQSDRRYNLELEYVRRSDLNSKLGIGSALTVALAVLGCACYVAKLGSPVAGTILGTADLIGLVGIFITGRYRNEKSKEQLKDEDSR